MDVPKGGPVDELIKQCLLEDRAGETEFTHNAGANAYTLRWRVDNKFGLVFVAVYQKILRLDYVDDLLESIKGAFAENFDTSLMKLSYPEFEEVFTKTLKKEELKANERKAPKTAPKAFDPAAKAAKRNDASGVAKGNDKEDENKNSKSTSSTSKDASSAFDMSKIKASLKSKSMHNSSSGNLSAKDASENESDKTPEKVKRTKEKRQWAGENKKGKSEGLDFSEGKPPGSGDDIQKVDMSKQSRIDIDENDEYSEEEEEEEDEIETTSGKTKNSKKKKTFFGSLLDNAVIKNVVGKNALDEHDLAPVLDQLKTNFMHKNVAEDIAEKLCESVRKSLVGKKLQSFSSLSLMTKVAMEEALTRILTPKRSVDILRDVKAAKEAGRPYVMTFVGVNGVGKSTNLSKVAYWLLQHGVSVMIAACDTFRAGAVEQLRTHCRRLDVQLFERGYEKDPANVANEAIKAAARQKVDVVLVDTAGRMQDNEPLMRALAKLININEPDLVLFVGEALVGNDAVDQLSKFNERLSDLSSIANKTRLIDGIVLSKFDTIDDKVGAALSMVYTSGAPVMFVGCGQTYTDLKRLNVKSVVKMLLSK